MVGFEVEPGELERAAIRLEVVTSEVERFWRERDSWLEAGRSVGSDRVQRALAVFCEYWTVALRSTLEDSGEIGTRLQGAADRYRATETAVVSR